MSLVLIGIIAFNEPITLVVRWPRRHEFLEIFGIALLSSLFTALGSMIDWELTSRNSKVVSAIEFGLLLRAGVRNRARAWCAVVLSNCRLASGNCRQYLPR